MRRNGLVRRRRERAAHRYAGERKGVASRARLCSGRAPLWAEGIQKAEGDEYFRHLSRPGGMAAVVARYWGLAIFGSARLDVQVNIAQIDGQGATTPCMTSEEPLIRMQAGCYGDGPGASSKLGPGCISG